MSSINPTFCSSTINYTAQVEYTVSSITVTPTAAGVGATIKVKGNNVISNTPSQSIILSYGTNTISTVVTAQDGTTTKTYTVVVTRPNAPLYNLRDIGPAGGLIFHIVNNGNGSYTYYEAAPKSTEWSIIRWQSPFVLIGASSDVAPRLTAIGTGWTNTIAIKNWLNSKGQYGRAAQLAFNLTHGGYSDWYLPSRDELYEMCWVLHSRRAFNNGSSWVTENNPSYGDNRVGDFSSTHYWSSSEGGIGGNDAGRHNFVDGYYGLWYKDREMSVRAIRRFTQ